MVANNPQSWRSRRSLSNKLFKTPDRAHVGDIPHLQPHDWNRNIRNPKWNILSLRKCWTELVHLDCRDGHHCSWAVRLHRIWNRIASKRRREELLGVRVSEAEVPCYLSIYRLCGFARWDRSWPYTRKQLYTNWVCRLGGFKLGHIWRIYPPRSRNWS